jgi:hypothetical protein
LVGNINAIKSKAEFSDRLAKKLVLEVNIDRYKNLAKKKIGHKIVIVAAFISLFCIFMT